MIVIGADPHKQSHTFAAVDAGTGEQLGLETVEALTGGHDEALVWARSLGSQRVWAIEDCRHVSGRLERFLVARGERLVRVPPKLVAGARKSGRKRGESDPIDALAVARAALREGIETLPGAHLDERGLEIRLLLDHRDDLVTARSADQQRLRWHLRDLFGQELQLPAGALDRAKWLDKLTRRLARQDQTARVRIARDLVRSIRQRTRRARELERELALLVRGYAPQLVADRGCGPLTAAKLIGELAGAERFSSDAKLARACGVAPIPVASGRQDRHRLDRGGNRQLNLALHRLAINKAKYDPATAAYLARNEAEGNTQMGTLRCLKHHLARHVHKLMTTPTKRPAPAPILT